ncbi:MAG: M1 family aminopeptidase [Bacteroidia bacterium]
MGLFLLLWAQNLTFANLEFYVSPDTNFIRGVAEWHFIDASAYSSWDVAPELRIDSIQASFAVTGLAYDTQAQKLFMNTPPAGWIRFYYQGQPSATGFGSFVHQRHATGWVLWTLSEPYGMRDWVPCRQSLGDKLDSVAITIYAPAAYVSVANGKLEEDTLVSSGLRKRRFVHRYPIAPYLIAFAVSNYVERRYEVPLLGGGSFPLINYVYPQDTTLADALTADFLSVFELFQTWWGPYPFFREHYAQVQVGFRGGMEHQTITFFGTYSWQLWVHELAHQWWGDHVTCASWQDIWLNEGFATWAEGLAFYFLKQAYYTPWRRANVRRAWQEPNESIYVPAQDTLSVFRVFSGPLSYSKAGLLLEDLRQTLGDEKFRQLCQYVLNRHGGAFWHTSDFEAALGLWIGTLEATRWVEENIFSSGFPEVNFIQLKAVPFAGKVAFVRGTRYHPIFLRLHTLGGMVDTTLFSEEELAFSATVTKVEIDPDTISLVVGRQWIRAFEEAFYVFPSPSRGELCMYVDTATGVELYALNGQRVWVTQVPQGISCWDLSYLRAGVYALISPKGKTLWQKLTY